MAIYQEDIVALDLNRACFHRSFLNHTLGANDISGNRLGLKLFRGGEPIDSTLVSCIGYFIRADGETVVVNGGLADADGVLAVTLPQACYAVLGKFTLVIKVTASDPGVTGTIRVVDGTVTETTTGVIVDPGTIVPQLTVEAIVAKISECEAAAQQAGLMVELIEKLGLYVDSEGYTCQKLSGES
jgi:hypothetical protein